MTPRCLARAAALAIAFAFAACAWAQAPAPKTTRILFIGNSLTYTLETPERVERLAKAMGRDAKVESVAFGDYSLVDHWADGRALAAIKKGPWDIVVLQQGASADPQSREELAKSVKQFAGPIRDAGARPALFMAWPSSDRFKDFGGAIGSYRAAAEANDAILLPVGEAWLRALSKDKRLKLYGDTIHQSSLGSDLAVLTIYLVLFPAGPQEFTEEFVAKAAKALDMQAATRDAFFDAATLAIDEPMVLK